MPVVNWAERGFDRPHNTVPRWHIVWGTGHEIISRLVASLASHPNRKLLDLRFDHGVSGFETADGRVTGVRGERTTDGRPFRVQAEHCVLASGGMCGGDLTKVRENWCRDWGDPPPVILNGSHDYADGLLHDRASDLGGNVTYLDRQWHYPSGVHHPAKRRPHDGLSLVPPRSALWVNAEGRRIGPRPLVPYTDTRRLVAVIAGQPGQYSWQILNRKIALRELAVSGCDFMTEFRFKRRALLLKNLIFGNSKLVDRLVRECPEDFVVASTLEALVEKMNERSIFGYTVDLETLRSDIEAYDAQIARGRRYHNDEQLRWIANFRAYRGDRFRTCKFQRILDPNAGPLMAIREFILSRKSLGGIQTDLRCRVLAKPGYPIPGLYAVGEAAGFGGGGIHGIGSLEGTFLGSCVLTGRVAARTIAGPT